MLIAHKVIDALLERGNRYKLVDLPGITDKQRVQIAAAIESAQKFDFGDLMLTKLVGGKDGRWKLPNLTPEEYQYWEDGLIPMPFQMCWYEFSINNCRSGLLVMQDMGEQIGSKEPPAPGTYIHRADLITGDEVVFDGILLGIEGATADGIRCSLSGNVDMIERLKRRGELNDNVIMNAPLAIYLTMMLNSRTTEFETVQPPKFLNRKRVKKGLTPLPPHRLVKIVPDKYRERAESEAKGEQRPPRLHWRRSHLRHFDHQTGNSKYVPTLMHKGQQGWWVTVIPRSLVGNAELGELTHEYQIG